MKLGAINIINQSSGEVSGTLYANKSNKWKLGIAWLIWLVMHAWVLHLYDINWSAAFIDSAISNSILLACIWLSANAMQYYLPSEGQISYIVALSTFTALVWFFCTKSLLLLIPGSFDDYNRFWNSAVPVRLSVGVLIIISSNLLNMLWLSLQKAKKEKGKAEQITDLARQAELMKLRQQLQPHFLFNSLNSINALITLDPPKARSMINQLAEFFRNTIAAEKNEKQTLENELQHLGLYLSIERVRFGERLGISMHVSEEARDCKIPALLLQPIMENAIKYGLYDTTGMVQIALNAFVTANILQIEITNPFDPKTNTVKKGTGFGLSSVGQRLFLLYGRQGLLETSVNENEFTTIITIPQL